MTEHQELVPVTQPGEPSSEPRTGWQRLIDELQRESDELRVRLHLARKEVAEELEKIDQRIEDLGPWGGPAFAPVVLAWAHDTGADLARTNVNGGAIAIGHPLGASGARIMTTLVNALEQRGGRYGLQTMCEGGGMANATIIERL